MLTASALCVAIVVVSITATACALCAMGGEVSTMRTARARSVSAEEANTIPIAPALLAKSVVDTHLPFTCRYRCLACTKIVLCAVRCFGCC